jgi:hypothetical protein
MPGLKHQICYFYRKPHMKILPYFLLLITCRSLFGQQLPAKQQHKLDSLAAKLKKDSAFIYRRTIARPYLRLENRRAFIVSEKVNFLGFLAGANLHERHIVCAGYYFLDRKSRALIPLRDLSGAGTSRFSKFGYFVLSYQYILLNLRYVQLNTPLEAGYGSYATDNPTGIAITNAGNFLPLCAGLQLILKPFKFAGVSASGGYRYVRHDLLSISFNGIYYSFGVWVDARYLFRGLRYHLVKQKYRETVRSLD